MSSIQQRLLASLLIGQGILWALAAIGGWFSVRKGLYSEFDNELRFTSAALRFHIRSPTLNDQIERRWPKFLEEGSGWYFQSWRGDGTVRLRSQSLGEFELPFPEKIWSEFAKGDYQIEDFEGPNGEKLRGVSVEAWPPQPRRPINNENASRFATFLRVGFSRSDLDHSLNLMAGLVGIAGLIAAALTTVLVRLSVRRGLRPLHEMGEMAASIDVSNLEMRFEQENVPAELKPISVRLNDLMARIEEGFQRERRFSSDLEHELRTPLAELKSTSELLARWPEESKTAHFKDIVASVTQIEGIMESLLTISRWESDAEPIETEEFEVGALVEDCWKPWARRAEEKHLDCELDLSNSPLLESDPGMFRLIVNNLISNAVEYTPERGGIRIEVGNEDPSRLFSITNLANGLKPEDVPNLTKRFWRHDESRTCETHSGLGLSVAAACAERLGFELKPELDEAQGLLQIRLQAASS